MFPADKTSYCETSWSTYVDIYQLDMKFDKHLVSPCQSRGLDTINEMLQWNILSRLVQRMPI